MTHRYDSGVYHDTAPGDAIPCCTAPSSAPVHSLPTDLRTTLAAHLDMIEAQMGEGTPGPWALGITDDWDAVVAAIDETVTGPVEDADARNIVLAVNNLPAQIAGARQVLALADRLRIAAIGTPWDAFWRVTAVVDELLRTEAARWGIT